MLLLDHILVATDFSTISNAALRHALGIASRCHSTVSLVHVIDALLYGMAPDGIAAAVDCAEWNSELVIKQLQHEGVLNGQTPEVTITVGTVWQTISNIIREQRPGLVVLGTHGRSGLPKLVLGSVAECAFRESPCPVLTVGPHVRGSKTSGAQARHLLVPTDLSMQSTNALRYGISLASATGGDMTLLHVLKPHAGRAGEEAPPTIEAKKQLTEFLNQHPVRLRWSPLA
jgi:nucleotide-binding universal stress UspA family protein